MHNGRNLLTKESLSRLIKLSFLNMHLAVKTRVIVSATPDICVVVTAGVIFTPTHNECDCMPFRILGVVVEISPVLSLVLV